MASLLAIYRTVAANQWHREGEEMIQPRQAQERVGNGGAEEEGRGERRALGVWREFVQETDSSAGVDKSDLSPPRKLGQARRTSEGADRN